MIAGGAGEFGGGFVRPEDRPASAEAAGDTHRREPSGDRPSVAPAPTLGHRPSGMIMSTTGALDGYRVRNYLGLVDADVILGANVVRDFFAGMRDVLGGRVAGYEQVLANAKKQAISAMVARANALQANAIIGIDLDFQTVQVEGGGSMMMVCASGTAVVIETQ